MHQFDTIAERIVDVATLITVQRLIPDGFDACSRQMRDRVMEVIDQKCRVCLARRCERTFDAQMKPDCSILKPATATSRQILRLWNFRKAEGRTIKIARFLLLTFRHCQLNMIESDDLHECADVK